MPEYATQISNRSTMLINTYPLLSMHPQICWGVAPHTPYPCVDCIYILLFRVPDPNSRSTSLSDNYVLPNIDSSDIQWVSHEPWCSQFGDTICKLRKWMLWIMGGYVFFTKILRDRRVNVIWTWRSTSQKWVPLPALKIHCLVTGKITSKL